MKTKELLSWFVLWKIMIFIFAFIATFLLPLQLKFTPHVTEYGRLLPYYVWIWGNFDGHHYLSIASHGYEDLKQPFFPFFPITIRSVSELLHIPVLPAAIVVSYSASLGAFFVVRKLLRLDGFGNSKLFWLILFLYPTSFFYGAIYNDALFFLFACLTILAGRQRKWAWAALWGAFATATRLNGLALFFFLIVEYLIGQLSIEKSWKLITLQKIVTSKELKTIWQSKVWFVTSIPFTFISYLTYIQIKFGDWRTLFTAMSVWNQNSMTFPINVFWRYMKIFYYVSPHLITYWVAVIEVMAILFYCFIFIFTFKKLRLSYWIFIVIAILIPWLTGTFQGMPRYALHLYPLFLGMTIFLEQRSLPARTVYFLLSTSLLLIILTLFTRGFFIT